MFEKLLKTGFKLEKTSETSEVFEEKIFRSFMHAKRQAKQNKQTFSCKYGKKISLSRISVDNETTSISGLVF